MRIFKWLQMVLGWCENQLTNLKQRWQKRQQRIARKEHMKTYGNDYRCSECGVWWSSHDNVMTTKFEYLDFGFSMRCGRCNKTTFFNCEIAPVAIQCDRRGIPL